MLPYRVTPTLKLSRMSDCDINCMSSKAVFLILAALGICHTATAQVSAPCLLPPSGSNERPSIDTTLIGTFPVFPIDESANSSDFGNIIAIFDGLDDDVGDTLYFGLIPNGDSSSFSINSTDADGVYQARKGYLRSVVPLDFEDGIHDFQLIVAIYDRNPTSGASDMLCDTLTVIVDLRDVNDNAPVFVRSFYNVIFREDVAIGFTTASMEVSANDADTSRNGRIDYAIVAGNDGGKFRIGQGSGTVRTNGTFDFETQSTYSLTIQAQDRGTPALSSNVTMNVTLLDVNDNRPILANTTLSVTIPRNTSVGAVIANFYATDADTGLNAQLTYTAFQQSIGSVPIIDPGLSLFVVNESTGAVSIGRSLCAADMREATQMTLQIQVADQGAVSLSTLGTLFVAVSEINPDAPRFAQSEYVVALAVGDPLGTEVVQALATEPANNCSVGSGITYAIIVNSDVSGSIFSIDRGSGVISTARAIAAGDAGSVYTLVVRASDNGRPVALLTNATVTVAINIADIYGTFRLDGLGYLLSPQQVSAQGGAQIDRGFFIVAPTSATSGGVATLAWGGLRIPQSYSIPIRLPAAVVTKVVVFETFLRPEDPRVRVVVQVSDAYGSVRVASTLIVAALLPDIQLLALNSDPLQATCTVPASTTDGTCSITFSNIPSEYFDALRLSQSRNYTMGLGYRIGGSGVMTQHAQSIRVLQTPAIGTAVVTDNVVLVAPSRGGYPGQTFTASVVGKATYEITVFTIVVDFSAQLALVLPLGVNNSRWSVTQTSTGSRLVVSGTVDTSYSLRTQPTLAPEHLFDVTFALATDATGGQVHTLDMHVDQLVQTRLGTVNVGGVVRGVGDDAPRGLFVDHRGGIRTDGATVETLPNNVVGVLAVPSARTVLLNAALLSGTTVSSALAMQACSACPGRAGNGRGICQASCSATAPSSLQCSTGTTQALSLDACAVQLTTSTTSSVVAHNVSIGNGNDAVMVPFTVWTPVLNVTITLEQTTLHPIASMFVGSGAATCMPLYQASAVSITVAFTNGGSESVTADVTEAMMDRVVVSDTSVAELQPSVSSTGSSMVVRGLRPGTTRVSVVRAGDSVVLGSTVITVTSAPVSPVRLTVFSKAFTGIDTTAHALAAATSLVTSSRATLTAVVNRNITVESTEVGVLVALSTSDARISYLNMSHGINITSSNPGVAAVNSIQDRITVVSSGTVDITATLAAGACNSTTLTPAAKRFQFFLDDPIGIDVVVATPRVTDAGAAARFLGIATVSDVTVHLHFPGGIRRDFSSDPRLQVDTAAARGLFTATTNTSGTRVVANAGTAGVGVLSVYFTHLNRASVQALSGNNVSITVVDINTSTINASPYPQYSGSRAVVETTLNRIANTSGFQMAALYTAIQLTDGTSVQVPATDSQLSYRVVQVSGAASPAQVSTLGSVQVLVPTAAGVVFVEGTYHTHTLERVQVEIVSTAVHFSSLAFTSQTFSTLRGVRGTTAANVFLSGVFSDGVVFPDLFVGGVPQLPGLIRFISNNASYVSINATTGRAVPLDNSFESVSITASAFDAAENPVQVTHVFACNLDPADGDMDLGRASGVPLGPLTIGASVGVSLRVNSGTQNIGPFEVRLAYDPTLIAVDDVVVGADLGSQGGTRSLLSRINDPPGLLVIVGVPVRATLIGDAFELVVITMRALVGSAGATGRIQGNITTLVEPAVVGAVTPIGVQGRAIDAGNVVFAVGGSTRRVQRDLYGVDRSAIPHSPMMLATPSNRYRRQTGPCTAGSVSGDSNFDCEFDVIDVAYASEYVVESLVGFRGSYGAAFNATPPNAAQLAVMDADQNGVRDAKDVLYLGKALVRMTRFLLSVDTISVNYTDCALKFSADVVMAGDQADLSAVNESQTLVYFMLSSGSANFNALFASSFDTCPGCRGGIVSHGFATVSGSARGGLLVATRSPTNASRYEAAIATDLTYAQVGEIGVSVIVVTRNSLLETNAERVAFFGGAPQTVQSLAFPGTLALNLSSISPSLDAVLIQGHNPKLYLNNTFRSSMCLNLFAPHFSQQVYSAVVDDKFAVNATILQIVATDADGGVGGTFEFDLTTNASTDFLRINATSGAMYATEPLEHGTYVTTVTAIDLAPPYNANSTTLTLTVTQTSIVFSQTSYSFTVEENATVRSVVFGLVVLDEEGSARMDDLEFSVDNTTTVFSINTNGQMRLDQALDFEQQVLYHFNVSVQETIYPYSSSEAVVTVLVTNVNDNAPEFIAAPQTVANFSTGVDGIAYYSATYNYGTPIGYVLLQVQTNDTDVVEPTGIASSVVFRLLESTSTDIVFDTETGEFVVASLQFRTGVVTIRATISATDADNLTSLAVVAVTFTKISNYFELGNTYDSAIGGAEIFRDFGSPLLDASVSYQERTPSRDAVVHAFLAVNHDGLTFDLRTFRVALQALERTTNVPLGQVDLTAVIVVDDSVLVAELTTAGVSANIAAGTCTTRSSDGTCVVAFSIPTAWFAAIASAREVTVRFGLRSTAVLSMAVVGAVGIRPSPDIAVARTVLVALPQRSLQVGESVTVTVSANAGFSTSAWQLRLETADTRLSISNVVVDRTKWTVESSQRTSHQLDITGFLADEDSVASGTVFTLELLFTMRVTVISASSTCTSSGSGCLSLNGTVISLASVREREVQTSAPIQFQDPFTTTSPSTIGRIQTYDNHLSGAFYAIGSTTLVNMAKLNGQAISVPLQVIGMNARGSTALTGVPTSALQCQSANPNAIRVHPTCNNVFLNGTETIHGGALGTDITVSVLVNSTTSLSLDFNVTVWFPQLPLDLEVDASDLYAVQGWSYLDTAVCVQGYQRSRIGAHAQFTPDGVRSIRARVTSQVAESLTTTDAQVAEIANVHVVGRGPGTILIMASNGIAGEPALGNVSVTVHGDLVSPSALYVYIGRQTTVSSSTGGGGGSVESPFVIGAGMDFDIQLNDSLVVVDERAGVAVFAAFPEGFGHPMLVRPADGLRLRVDDASVGALALLPTDTNNVSVVHSTVVAVSSNPSAVVHAMWSSACGAGSATPFVNGSGAVDVRTQPPLRAEVQLSATTVTAPGDPSTTAGIASSITIDVFLVFATEEGERRKNVTADANTVYNMSTALTRVSLCTPSAASLCSPSLPSFSRDLVVVDGGDNGIAGITVSFLNANVTAEIAVTVVRTESVHISLHPFPEYPGSLLFATSTLHRFQNSFSSTAVFQQAIPYLHAVLSNQTNYTLVPSVATYTLDRADVVSYASSTRVLGVVASHATLLAGDLSVQIGCTVNGFRCENTTMRATNTAVTISALQDLRLYSQRASAVSVYALSGLNGSNDQVIMGAQFSDGTRHPTLFSGATGAPLLPDLISFVSANDAVLSVGALTGSVTLHNNYHAALAVTASVRGSAVSQPIAIACNVDPGLGDADIGASSGIPIPAKNFGATFTVPIRVNSGSSAVGAIELSIQYNADVFTVVSIARGSTWPGGVFEAVVDPPGTITVGGSPQGTGFRGTAAELAVVTMRVTTSTTQLTSITGTVRTFAEPPSVDDLAGRQIGASVPRSIVAGAIVVQIMGTGRHQRDMTHDAGRSYDLLMHEQGVRAHKTARHTRVRRQDGLCATTTPCAACPFVREIGDANGDCVFDLRDVAFTQVFLLEQADGFVSARGRAIADVLLPFQESNMDADRDGQLSALDPRFLARVNFGLLRFVEYVSVFAPQDLPQSRGLLNINVSIMAKGNVQAGSDLAQVYLDIASADSSVDQQFRNTVVEQGGLITANKGSGLYGLLLQLQRVGPLYNSASTTLMPNHCQFLALPSAFACSASTLGQDFYLFSITESACVAAPSTACVGNTSYFATQEACEDMCVPTYVHMTKMNTSVVANDIGISVIIVTFNAGGVYSSGRSEFLATAVAGGLPAYDSTFAVTLGVRGTPTSPVANVDIGPFTGYSPLVTFNSTVGSDAVVNRFSPTLPAVQTTVVVNEMDAVDTLITTFRAEDADIIPIPGFTPAFQYAVALPEAVGADDMYYFGRFRLNGNTGQLFLNTSFDFETLPTSTYDFTLLVTDNGVPTTRTAIIPIRINFTDANDNRPIFAERSYTIVAGIDGSPGDVLGSVQAADNDTGVNAIVVYSINGDNCTGILGINQAGVLSILASPARTVGTVCNTLVRATDALNPALFDEVPVSVAFVNDDFLVTIAVVVNHLDFARSLEDGTSCIPNMEALVGASIAVVDVAPSATAPAFRSEVTFYATDVSGGVLSAQRVSQVLLSNANELGQLSCAAFVGDDVQDNAHAVSIAFYSDVNCTQSIDGVAASTIAALANTPSNASLAQDTTLTYDIRGAPQTCLSDRNTQNSARITCSGLPLASASIRIFRNVGCNPPTYLQAGASATETGSVVPNHACVAIERLSAAEPELYVRAECVGVVVTTAVTGTSEPPVLQPQDGSDNKSSVIYIAAACGGAVLLCWILAVLLVLRGRKQKEDLSSSNAFPIGGDIAFGASVEMQRDAVEGGQVDPFTGEIKLFTTGGDDGTDGDMSNIRVNPIINLLPQSVLDESNTGIGDDDSLGDLSDFDEADFEEFADSLLQSTGTAGDTELDEQLFGQSSAEEVVPRKKSVTFAAPEPAPAPNNRYSTVIATDLMDDLSDFEGSDLDEETEFLEGGSGPDRPQSYLAQAESTGYVGRAQAQPTPGAQWNTLLRQQQHQEQRFRGQNVANNNTGYLIANVPVSHHRLSAEVDAQAIVTDVQYSNIGQDVLRYN